MNLNPLRRMETLLDELTVIADAFPALNELKTKVQCDKEAMSQLCARMGRAELSKDSDEEIDHVSEEQRKLDARAYEDLDTTVSSLEARATQITFEMLLAHARILAENDQLRSELRTEKIKVEEKGEQVDISIPMHKALGNDLAAARDLQSLEPMGSSSHGAVIHPGRFQLILDETTSKLAKAERDNESLKTNLTAKYKALIDIQFELGRLQTKYEIDMANHMKGAQSVADTRVVDMQRELHNTTNDYVRFKKSNILLKQDIKGLEQKVKNKDIKLARYISAINAQQEAQAELSRRQLSHEAAQVEMSALKSRIVELENQVLTQKKYAHQYRSTMKYWRRRADGWEQELTQKKKQLRTVFSEKKSLDQKYENVRTRLQGFLSSLDASEKESEERIDKEDGNALTRNNTPNDNMAIGNGSDLRRICAAPAHRISTPQPNVPRPGYTLVRQHERVLPGRSSIRST
ncbi:hypothetical protein MBM_01364 [Drepanopeziza brunnea f. sp. 'multigermtubi' MB_m1]|uniref:Uncharacterized protein n=1 Tax=Marssonina brunnea f. sp. multigermtubi (strain MB_m1) TaxID=1072389 RepID=K1X6F0_MARBU|nr:uncharacterized protein MBM_01364 [Drepanopeziza brunnea f. sp. 'multigermtubi' MB_m1]EKD20682.1 hypothetical protein MBM_01364 [Drepanopeziza brunnea f. sp. 'multigermtubi' MB_m1]